MTKVIREISSQENSTTSDGPAPHPKRRSHFGRWLLILLALVGTGLFFLPTLAGMAVRSPETLAWISGQPPGTIEIGQANLTWQGPVQLKNVVLQTPDGHPIANVETLTSNQTLWGLLTQQKQKIKLNLDGVRYTVVVPDPGAMQVNGNVDVSTFTSALQDFNVPAPTLPMEISVSNCVIQFQNKERQPIEQWDNLSATYLCDPGEKFVQEVTASLPAASDKQTGEMTLTGKWERENNSQRTETLSLETSANALSLKAAAPWLDKYLGANHGLTTCTGQLQASLNRDQNAGWSMTAQGQLNGPVGSAGIPVQGQQIRLPGETILQLEGRFSKPDDELTVSRFQLAADQTAVDLQGSVKQIFGPQILQMIASVKAPGAAIMDLIPVELRKEIQIEGAKFSQLTVNGALRPEAEKEAAPLTYSLVAAWDRILAYGLNSEKGQLRIHYRGGQVSAEPIDVSINGGRLLMLPTLDLTAEPPTVHFQEGTVLEGVELTEEICRGWLMYISPTLAHATSANGRFNLTVNKGTLPLGQPEKGDVGGVVAIRDGVVRPGPLANQMLQQVAALQSMLNRGGEDLTRRAILSMKKEDVAFRLYQGRVYHENFGADVGEMRIATAGSMGLDETLDMKLNITFPEKWLAVDRPVLRALAGTPIQIGVTGSLGEPRLDGSSLANFGRQIGINAGVNLLDKLIERRQQRGR